MKRRRANAGYSFHPGLVTGRQQRSHFGRVPYNRRVAGMLRKARGSGRAASAASGLRSEVVEALVGQGYKRKDAQKKVSGASGTDFSSLFRSALSRNPRTLPEMTDSQIQAIQKLIKGKRMASKKRRTKKKKHNPRKGVMPAGLRKYWAKKRAKKSRRRKKRNPRPRVRIRTRTVVKYRYRSRPKHKATPRRRRAANPLRRAKRINLKGFTPSQIKRVASAIRSATGKRVRVVRP